MADDVSIRIGADPSGLSSALNSAKSSVTSFRNEVQGSLDGLTGAFSGVTGAIQGIASLLGAGVLGGALAGVVSSIERMTASVAEMRTMADTIGVSTDQFQAMAATADEAGVSMNVFARATEKLSTLLADARDGSGAAVGKLRDMGVTLQQINDPGFTLNDLLGVLRERLNNASTAQGEHNTLLKEFGGRLAQAIDLIKTYDGSLAGIAEKNKEINALAPEQVKRLQEISGWWKTLATEIGNAAEKGLIFLAAKPDFSSLPKLGLLGSPTSAGDLAGNQQTGAAGQDAQKAQAQAAQQTQEIVVTASHTSTESILKDLKEQVAATQAGTAERVAATKKYYDEALSDLGKNADTTKAAYAELLSAEREYQDKRLALERETTAAIKASTAAALAEAKLAMQEANKALDEMVEDAKSTAKQIEDSQVGAYTRGIEAIHAAAEAHKVSASQELTETTTLLNAEWAAQQAYYAKLRAMAVAAGESTKTIDDQEEAAHQKYLDEMQKADEKYHTQVMAQWKQLGQSIANSFASNLTGMIEGTKTFANAVKSLLSTMIDGILQMFIKMALQWAENQIAQMTASKTTAVSGIAANSAVAATAAMASVAAIPFVGWVMAPEVGATTFAEGMAYTSALSAEGGMDIPAGTNPLTQLHSQEMVLPQKYADVIRDMAGNGSGGGGGGDTFHLSASSLDAKGMEALFKTPGGRAAIAAGLKSAYRRGSKGARR